MTSSRLVVAALVGWLLVGLLAAAPQFVPGPGPRWSHAMAYDSARSYTVMFGGKLSGGSSRDLWEWDGIRWIDRTPSQLPAEWPSAREAHAMTYDALRQKVVLFGGQDAGGNLLNDTWEWDGVVWTNRTPAPTSTLPYPDARYEHAMTYDSLRNVVILHGGDSASGARGDTWEYDGASWVALTANSAQPRAWRHRMAFDSSRGKTVMFAGFQAQDNGPSQRVWEYDGNSWTEATPLQSPSPGNRSWHSMAYDVIRQVCVVYGGRGGGPGNNNGPNLSDVWEWDGVTWTSVSVAGAIDPGARRIHCAVYDQADQSVLIYGGYRSSGLSDTWSFDGSYWHPKLDYVTSPINGNRYALTPPMTWTDAEDLAVLEGGHLATVRSQAEQNWLWQAFGNQQPLHIGYSDAAVEGQWEWASGESATYTNWRSGAPDNAGGNQHYASMWGNVGGQWDDDYPTAEYPSIVEHPGGPVADVITNLLTTTATPAPVREHAVAALPSGGALLFGGQTASGPFFPTYELQGADWNKQFSFNNPMIRTGHTLLLDQARQNNLMFGGENPLGTKLADTWTYANGQWSYLTPTNAPSPRSHHAMAYDPTTDTGILFGGEDAFATAIGDMWQWDGADWTQVAPATLPPARMRHSIVWDRLRDVLVLFGGTDGTTRLDDVWEWDGIDWAQITPAQPSGITYGPDPRDGFVMAYDPLSQRVVVIGGETDSGCVDDFWSWDGIAWVKHFATSGGALPSARKGAQIFFDASANELRLHGGGCGSNYSDELWSFQLPVFARSEVIGVGCAGSNGVPTLDIVNGTTPVIGTTVDFLYSNALNSTFVTPAIVAVGFDQSSYQGIPLPLPLAVIGLPGCTLYHSNDVSVSVGVLASAAQFTWSLGLPNSANFLGQEMFVQGLHLEFPGAGSWAALSNAVGIRIGDQ